MLHEDIFIWYMQSAGSANSPLKMILFLASQRHHTTASHIRFFTLFDLLHFIIYTHTQILFYFYETRLFELCTNNSLILMCSSHLSGALWKTIFYNPPNIRAMFICLSYTLTWNCFVKLRKDVGHLLVDC